MIPSGRQKVKGLRVKTADLARPGNSPALREYRRGTGVSLDLDPRIDLTKPIYEQAQKLDAQDQADERQHEATAA